MLTLVVRRALAQRRLFAGVVALVTVGTTLLGVCVLLLGATQDRAFTAGIQLSQPEDVDVTAFLVGVPGPDVADVRREARAVIAGALAPLGSSLTSNADSRMRRLGSDDRVAYLASSDSLDRRAALVSGRWPAPAAPGEPAETVVPTTTADRLRLGVGAEVTLGQEIGTDPVETPVTVVVVGTFRVTSRTGWETDPLSGAGYQADFNDGSRTRPAYGPFVVDDASYLATGSTTDALQVTGRPALGTASDETVGAAVAGLARADALLSARVGDRVRISRLASELSTTLDRVRTQQGATRSTVLVVLLLVTVLSLAALLLAGRLLDAVREDERALLLSRGLGRVRLVVATLGETVLLGCVAAVLAGPAATLAHAGLTHLPALREAGLAQSPGVTPGLAATVLGGALVLALVLVVPVVGVGARSDLARRGRVAVATRSGTDLLLLVVVVVAWWQLHSRTAASTSGDVTRTLAPVLAVVAATALAVRCVPPVLVGIARVALRSRGLVLPLAAGQAARRPHAGAAMALLALASATATFGLATHTTWEHSQADQAALRVGTDLSLALATAPTGQDAAAVLGAAGGAAVSAVVERPLALGRFVGDPGSPPVLVAVDTTRAGALLRGRLDTDGGWAGIGALLAPGPAVGGVPLPDGGAGMTVVARSGGSVPALVSPTLVLQDDAGFRSAVGADPVPADGRPHPLRWLAPVGTGLRLVAAELVLARQPGGGRATGTVAASVDLTVPSTGPDGGPAASWQVQVLDPADTPVQAPAVTLEQGAAATVLRTTARLDLDYFAYSEADLLATSFAPPPDVPVAVSRQLADAVGTTVGGVLSATVGGVELSLRVAAIVPTVPSEPGRVAVLADADTLSRALVEAGRLDPVVDGWWVADPSPGTPGALRALGLGEVTTRDQLATQLSQGPLRVTVPAALLTLVVAAVVLLLAGAGLALGADQRRRVAEVARLRALGLSRWGARRLLLAEHGALLVLLVLTGTVVGAAASVAIAPRLVRSDVGTAPVPDALVAWPWLAEGALVGGLLLGCVVVAAVVAGSQVRRSDTARMREDEP